MRAVARIKLLVGALLVITLVAFLTRHLDQQVSTVHEQSATLKSEEYTLGTDYAGVLANLYVEVGDEVAVGDPVAVVKSNLLNRDIENGLVDPRTSPYVIRDNNALVLRATSAGTVTSTPFVDGTFVPEGSALASIRVKGTTFVEARFLLTTQEYAEISTARTVTVTLPNDDEVTATIADVVVSTRGKQAATTVTATAPELADDPLFGTGTPVDVRVTLPKEGIVTAMAAAITGLLTPASQR